MKCHNCTHCRQVPNNVHVACGHQDVANYGLKRGLIILKRAILAHEGAKDDELVHLNVHMGFHIALNPYGIRHDWCFWPVLFDPTWVAECSNFEERGQA